LSLTASRSYQSRISALGVPVQPGIAAIRITAIKKIPTLTTWWRLLESGIVFKPYIRLTAITAILYDNIVKFSLRKLLVDFYTTSEPQLLNSLPAYGPEVVGSNPTPATKKRTRGAIMLPFDFWGNNLLVSSPKMAA